MNINDLSKNNPDGTTKQTLKEAMEALKAGKAVDPNFVKVLSELSSATTANSAFAELGKTHEVPPVRLIPRPLSRNDMAELMDKQQGKVRRMEIWTACGVIIALLALIVAVLTYAFK